MRAPPESFRPITGAPFFIAMSMILQIFSACASRERAAEDGEILREDEDQPAVDAAVAGDDPVAKDALLGQAEVGVAVDDKRVELVKGAFVEQQVDALAGGQFAFGVLLLDAALAAAFHGLLAQFPQMGDAGRGAGGGVLNNLIGRLRHAC